MLDIQIFLVSLSPDINLNRCHPDALKYRKDFEVNKEELAIKLYQIFNKECFNSEMAQTIDIIWNSNLTKAAGQTKNFFTPGGIRTRKSIIELSPLVLSDSGRIRDTILHEMCHSATFLISRVSSEKPHGKVWKNWAKKAMDKFPKLPKIEVSHSYKRFAFKCDGCDYQIKTNNDRLIDTIQTACGRCHGNFEFILI